MTELHHTLRSLAPFEELTEEQARWLAGQGTVEEAAGNQRLYEPGTQEYAALWILLEGEIVVSRVIGAHEIEAARSDVPGAWAGAVPGAGDTSYDVTARASKPSKLYRIPRAAVDEMVSRGFPIAQHFLAGLMRGTRNIEALVRHQEKLESLGKLAAGLAHEMNNPAAAARRASSELRELLQGLETTPPPGSPPVDLAELHPPRELSSLDRSSLEEDVSAWLGSHGVEDADRFSPELVDAGVSPEWLESIGAQLSPAETTHGVAAWLTTTLVSRRLLDDIDEGLRRITDLVQAMKSYSYMDRTPLQQVDLSESIEDTLKILKHKLGGIDVQRSFEPDLPRIEAFGSELNQVWTNLLDNAADALDGKGHIVIRAARDGPDVVVEVTDDGPGIPEEIRSHIFDAFFTTKNSGFGLGLGLEITHRTVVRRHGGDIRVASRPGETRFTVRLPIRLPASVTQGD